jgi:uncharacterized linocin/CFP29 family protein
MANTESRAGFWNDEVWTSIDSGVQETMGAIRVAQKVFPRTHLPNVKWVPADHFDFEKMSIAEGDTLPYIELVVEFSLTNGQVNEDPTGAAAITLAKLAAKSLALGEDMIILQGRDAALPTSIRIESPDNENDCEVAIRNGILGFVAADKRIDVKKPDPEAPTNSGGEILAAVAKGIALLTKETQAPAFALIADTNAFQTIWGSVINGTPAYTVLNPVLAGGIHGTGAMPPNTAVLIALGGDPTTIYFSADPPVTEPTHKGNAGRYFFRTFERIQYVARDHRAFVRLDFSYLVPSEPGKE